MKIMNSFEKVVEEATHKNKKIILITIFKEDG